MEKNWVCIFTSAHQQQAELIRGLLSHNEIQNIIVNKQDSFYKFGDFEIFVTREDVVKAKFVMKENNSSL